MRLKPLCGSSGQLGLENVGPELPSRRKAGLQAEDGGSGVEFGAQLHPC